MNLLPFTVLCAVLTGMSALCANTQAPQTDVQPAPALTVEEIVRLTRAGVAEDLIAAKIKKNGKAFDLNADEILDLKKYGVTETLVKLMLDPTLPYAPPAPPAPAAAAAKATKKYPADSYANRVPMDIGFYFVTATGPVKIDEKVLLGAEEPRGFMKKPKTVGYLSGNAARARFTSSMPLYLRLPESKTMGEELVVRLSVANGRRQLDAGGAAAKQQFKPEDVQPFDSVEVGAQLFRIDATKTPAGEYVLLAIGSAEPSRGIYGKGYDFAIAEEPGPGAGGKKPKTKSKR